MTAANSQDPADAGRRPARAAAVLRLAAAPAFAAMALATLAGRDPQAMICAAAMDASPLAGMAPMYLLMSAFHLGPWLEMLARE